MIYDGYNIIDIEDFTPLKYETFKYRSTYKKNRYYNCISVLDVETSWNHNLDNPKTWIYQWAWLLNYIIVVGRTKEQIIKLMHLLQDNNSDGVFRTFIHNLPYEFSYLWRDWNEEFTQQGEIMASAPHKPFKCQYGNFEFMCSYKVSNRSLSAWGKYYDVKHKKIDNGIDYQAINYPTDTLSDTDWLYMYHDVICVKECLECLMKQENMRYDKLLMTSTMFVKNEVTKRYKETTHTANDFKKKQFSARAYQILRKSFVGGITHANFDILNTTVQGNIQHFDYDSHYPTQMITKQFPSGRVSVYTTKGDNPDIHLFLPNDKHAYWCLVEFKGLHLRSDKHITMPYISISKCEGLRTALKDNGRLVSTDDTIRLYLSSYDVKWLLKQYTTSGYVVIESYRSKLGTLPTYLTDTIMHCYTIKSRVKKELSNMDIKSDKYRELNSEYLKSKNVLNGLYGVTATDPIRDDIIFDNGSWHSHNTHDDIESITEKLNKYYNSRERWTRYEVGTWVTSLARDELMTCIELVGYDNFLYCDTDSIFFIANDDNLKAIEKLNNEWLQDSIDNNYGVEVDGKMKYMHKFDGEEPLKAFRTLGAKCYAYITHDNIFNCVIAGVPSIRSYLINGETVTYKREDELGSIDNLTEGFVFTKSAPTTSIYTEDGCIIANTTHTISIAESDGSMYYELTI